MSLTPHVFFADSGNIEIPLGWVVAIGTALCGVIGSIFWQLISTNEKRITSLVEQNKTTMQHHDAFVSKADQERKQADADRKEYISRLEDLTRTISQDRLLLGEQIVKSQTANTEALNMNTRARESAATEMEKLMREVAGAVIVKLNELGYLVPPQKTKPAKRKLLKKPGVK